MMVTWPDVTCDLAGVEAEAAHLVVLCCRAAVPRGLIAGTLWPDVLHDCAGLRAEDWLQLRMHAHAAIHAELGR